MKDGQKLKLGDAHVTPKTYPRSTSVKAWGCPRHPLLHQQKYQVSFKTLYFYSFTLYVLFLERHFCFAFSFVLFSCCNNWLDPNRLVWGYLMSALLYISSLVFHNNCLYNLLFPTATKVNSNFALVTFPSHNKTAK